MFLIRKNTMSGRGSAVLFLFGQLLFDLSSVVFEPGRNNTPWFEQWPLDLTN